MNIPLHIPLSKTFHFIGIGGAGMNSIARILIQKGYRVTGSDLKENAVILRLKDMGAKIFLKHDASHLRSADIVVVSTAIKLDNPELVQAKEDGLPIYHRSEVLAMIMNSFAIRISVVGTHGKTTTTAMMARMLEVAGLSPTYILGGEMVDFKSNSLLGTSEYFVAESDESDGSFLNITPNVGIMTNLEAEHMDYYGTETALRSAFKTYCDGVISRNGVLVVNRDDEALFASMSEYPTSQVVSYGIECPDARVKAESIVFTSQGVEYRLSLDGVVLGDVRLRVFGRHNVYNSLAVFAYGLDRGLSFDTIAQGILQFSGTKRRLQWIGSHDGIDIYDDYAHHPTEILTTLSGVKVSFNRRLVCIFQPHRFTRTRDLLEAFATSFHSADWVVLTDIYSANEANPDNMSGQWIVDKMTDAERAKTLYVSHKPDIALTIIDQLRPGDVVVTMGAGDIYTVGTELLQQLRVRDTLDVQEVEAHLNP